MHNTNRPWHRRPAEPGTQQRPDRWWIRTLLLLMVRATLWVWFHAHQS